jgi:hypothetical protein
MRLNEYKKKVADLGDKFGSKSIRAPRSGNPVGNNSAELLKMLYRGECADHG